MKLRVKDNIAIKKINNAFAVQLLEILNKDSVLLNALGTKENKEKIYIKDFLKYNDKWCKINYAELFAIIHKDIAIGIISLSNQDIKNKKAKVGYWIGSNYWGKGYTTEAFEKILNYARKKGIIYLSSKIKKNNIASRKIWENKDAKIEIIDEYLYAYITI